MELMPENLQHPAQPNGLIQRVEHDDGDGNQEGPTGQSCDGCSERWPIETVRNPRQRTHGTDDANRMPYPWMNSPQLHLLVLLYNGNGLKGGML